MKALSTEIIQVCLLYFRNLRNENAIRAFFTAFSGLFVCFSVVGFFLNQETVVLGVVFLHERFILRVVDLTP